jgi:protocatechuate 3,4-dioxygenase alpha subunit
VKQSASQTVGPYLRIGLIYGKDQNNLVQADTAGKRIKITGVVYDGNDEPVKDAMVEIWQADANGIFNHADDPLQEEADPNFRGFGRSETRKGGTYTFTTIKPGSRDGHAPYINLHLFGRGMLLHALTRIYFEDEGANTADPVLSAIEPERRPTLIATLDENNGMVTYRFDIHIQGESETVFFDAV